MKPLRQELRLALPATLAAATDIVAEVKQRQMVPPGPPHSFCIELLVREAVTNAVVHGCNGTESGTVLCVVRRQQGRLFIWVEDNGPGFDWRARGSRSSDPAIPGGRGIEIFEKFATRHRFNAKGNGVALLYRFEGE
ncbi:MAG: ATP-binding protein [Bryobacteraceae bacterium]